MWARGALFAITSDYLHTVRWADGQMHCKFHCMSHHLASTTLNPATTWGKAVLLNPQVLGGNRSPGGLRVVVPHGGLVDMVVAVVAVVLVVIIVWGSTLA